MEVGQDQQIKEFEVLELKPGQFLRTPQGVVITRPVKCWVAPHGGLLGKPAYVLEMIDLIGQPVICQIDHQIFKDAFEKANLLENLRNQ